MHKLVSLSLVLQVKLYMHRSYFYNTSANISRIQLGYLARTYLTSTAHACNLYMVINEILVNAIDA